MREKSLLLILVGTVPLVALLAVVAAFLLKRAGYGVLVWGGIPFVGMILVSGTLSAVLGLAAIKGRRSRRRD